MGVINKRKGDVILFTVISIFFLTKFLISDGYSGYQGFFFMFSICLMLYWVYKFLKQYYNNMLYYVGLLFVIVVLFPSLHYVSFISNKDNYTFNQEYVNYHKKLYEAELKKLNDELDYHILTRELPKNILNMKVHDSLIGKTINYKNGSLHVKYGKAESKPLDLFRDAGYIIVDFYDNKNVKYSSVNIFNEKIIDAIDKKKNKINNINVSILEMRDNLHFGDLWLDSVTVFIFSNIKPLGRIPQILQFLQIITLSIFGYMTTTWIDTFKIFKISKKEEI